MFFSIGFLSADPDKLGVDKERIKLVLKESLSKRVLPFKDGEKAVLKIKNISPKVIAISKNSVSSKITYLNVDGEVLDELVMTTPAANIEMGHHIVLKAGEEVEMFLIENWPPGTTKVSFCSLHQVLILGEYFLYESKGTVNVNRKGVVNRKD